MCATVLCCAGITSTITIVLWIILTSNTPTEHRRISKLECEYIVNSLKGEVAEAQPTVSLTHKNFNHMLATELCAVVADVVSWIHLPK